MTSLPRSCAGEASSLELRETAGWRGSRNGSGAPIGATPGAARHRTGIIDARRMMGVALLLT